MSYWYTRSWYTRSLTAFVTLSFILPASAQNSPQVVSPVRAASSPATLTGKERLGRKWMDEQRIDNCNVPVDKRGSKPRPSGCPHTPTG
jgi:hypothetical protein